uniref:Phosphatidylinositol transfer protein alpha isoform n=1 Tax=Cynoglossus semilaevis TaxID=244447 RepID=A0A3P8V6Y6_CYNSE
MNDRVLKQCFFFFSLFCSRIVLPISVEEYQVGQLYAVAEASKNETGGGEGVEVLENSPYDENGEKGQYTHKIYHLDSKVPSLIRFLAPQGALEIHEKAWNAYPYCRTEFMIKIETWHKPDFGEQENVHGLPQNEWDKVKIVNIDIADRSAIPSKDYKEEFDPALFKSEKTGRGPLGPDWKKELANNPNCPHMCAYKLVSVRFKWAGLQNKIESLIHKMERQLFAIFHRQVFCWIDKWIDLTMEDIRRMEEETKKELDQMTEELCLHTITFFFVCALDETQ